MTLRDAPIHVLSQDIIFKCPHYIVVPDHYRADNTCRCNDPSHTEMRECGYRWNANKRLWEGDE
jgi:hypothetical protein